MARLTKRFIDALDPPAEGELVVFDDRLPGFGVRLKRSGVISYFVQYRNAHGRSKRLTLGRHGVLTPDQARRKALTTLAEVTRGEDPAEERSARRGAVSFAVFSKRYLTDHVEARNKTSTARHVRSDLRNHILPALGTKPLEAIGRADIVRLHLKLRGTPNAANRVLRVLSKMMNEAEGWGLRPRGSNPCVAVKKFPEAKRQRFLNNAELVSLGEAISSEEASGELSPIAAALLRLIALTGCRGGEVISLRWEEVDLERRLLLLADSKTGAKVVPLAAPAIALLENLPRTSPFVFPSPRDRSRPYVEIKRAWHRVRTHACLPDVRLHDLRHTHASVGAAAGLSLQAIGKLLGHSQLSSTARYAHLVDDLMQEAASRVQERIATALDGKADAKVIPLRRQVPSATA